MRLLSLIIVLLFLVSGCQKKVADPQEVEGFENSPLAKAVSPGVLDEASGIADSKQNPGYLWVQQDSGNPNDIALLSHDGNFLKTIKLNLTSNRDWEDMALANGPVTGTSYIYLADIGDNSLVSPEYFIYRFGEPVAAANVVGSIDKIRFQYPDGPHDAETVLVDHNTKDILIITKQDIPSRVYKLSYPQSTGAINIATLSGTLPFSGATSAAVSPDGKEILVKTYTAIWEWKKNEGQTIEQAFTGTPMPLSYQLEPQGEAVCFKNDNTGFFTLSERPAIIAAVNLNFYKRK